MRRRNLQIACEKCALGGPGAGRCFILARPRVAGPPRPAVRNPGLVRVVEAQIESGQLLSTGSAPAWPDPKGGPRHDRRGSIAKIQGAACLLPNTEGIIPTAPSDDRFLGRAHQKRPLKCPRKKVSGLGCWYKCHRLYRCM